MQVAIHQPSYWPWPRYIHKVMSADVFVYLDTVQFSKNGVQNRNQIKTATGAHWLTLSVKHRLGQRIQDTRIAEPGALEKHWQTIANNYRRTPGFPRWKDELERLLLGMQTESLCDAAIATTEWILDKLGVQNKRVRASEISGAIGTASALIASICSQLGASRYLTGVGAIEYMQAGDFSAIGCEVWMQEWSGLTYPQAYPDAGFVPDLSTLDLLMNCPEDAKELIAAAGQWAPLWVRA